MEKEVKKEINRIKKLLTGANVSDDRIKILLPIIENTAWMRVKLDETRELVKEEKIVIPYDNGGGQKGVRENPAIKAYEALWKNYMLGMNVIIQELPQISAKRESEKVENVKTMLEIVRDKHRKEA